MSRGESVTPPDWPVWVEGEVLPFARARWPLADVGLLFGRAVFTTVPWHGGRALFWQRHLARLERDRAAFALPPVLDAVDAALAAFAPFVPRDAGALRVHVSAGPGGADHAALHVALLPRPVSDAASQPAEPMLARAARVWTAGDPLGAHKHTARHARNAALLDARHRGADDVLLEDGGGGVIAASSACLVVRLGDQVVAPGPQSGALDGVARGLLQEAWRGEGDSSADRDWTDRAVRPDELERAEELLLVGSVSGVRAARGLLGRAEALPGRAGPLARTLETHWRTLWERELGGGAEDPCDSVRP